VTVQSIPYPLSGPIVKSMSLQFRLKDVTWDSVNCFAQVQIGDISCSFIKFVTKFVRHDLLLVKLCWLSRIASLFPITTSKNQLKAPPKYDRIIIAVLDRKNQPSLATKRRMKTG